MPLHQAALPKPRGFRLLALALLVALTVPRMVQRGMFVDGMFYASVARNMAMGQGTFWAPSYSATVYSSYFEQPPLGIALESVAYRLGGDRFAVERVYSLLMLAIAAGLIAAIWRLFYPAQYDWLPIGLWVLPSVVTWAAVNNMLENTQAPMALGATYALLRAARSPRAPTAIVWGISGGLLVAAAAMAKGPVGLFPLAVPGLILILPPEERQRAGPAALGLVGAVVAVAAFVWLTPAPRQAMVEYFQQQLNPTFSHRPPLLVQIVASWRHLFGGIVARLGVVVGALWLMRQRKLRIGISRAAWFLLVAALAASLPLMLSPKINGHYLVPSVGLFALAAAAFAFPSVESLTATTPSPFVRRIPGLLACGLLIATIVVPAVHGPLEPRDLDTVAEMDTLAKVVPRNAVLGTCATAAHDWGLLAYLQRFLRISLDPSDRPVGGWFVQPADVPCVPPVACQRDFNAPVFTLFRCPDGRQ